MSYSFKRKNKWMNQKIHKKFNKIQHASKHYSYANHKKYEKSDIIFKKKYPYKQRKDVKKFKAHRAREEIFKHIAFDFEDFVGNRAENDRQIHMRHMINEGVKADHRILCDAFADKSDNVFQNGSTDTISMNKTTPQSANLQDISNEYVAGLASAIGSGDSGDNDCYKNVSDYLDLIIPTFTDHVFDTIPGLMMIIGKYIPEKPPIGIDLGTYYRVKDYVWRFPAVWSDYSTATEEDD